MLLLSLQFELPGGDVVGQARVQPRRVVLHRRQAGVVVGVGDVAPLGRLGGELEMPVPNKYSAVYSLPGGD